MAKRFGIPRDFLPPKKLTNSMAIHTLELRREALEHYLQRLINRCLKVALLKLFCALYYITLYLHSSHYFGEKQLSFNLIFSSQIYSLIAAEFFSIYI